MVRKGYKQDMRVNHSTLLKGLNFASGILTAPSPKRIKKLTFAVTNMCNCKCMMCNIWKTYRENKALLKGEMNLEQIKNIFSNSKALRKVEKISFTGGEPFLRSDFTDIFLFFYRHYPNSIFDITSNGQNPALIRKSMGKILSLIDPSRLNFLVSLDGLKNTHDKTRGKAGAFEKADETLHLIRELSTSVRLVISFTIVPWNYRELLDVYHYAQSLGISMAMRFASMNNNFYYNINRDGDGWRAEELSEAENLISRVISEIQSKRSLLGKTMNSDIYYFTKMTDYMRRPRRIEDCYSGTHSVFMNPYGMVYPCINLDTCMGCVLDNGFDSVWNSPRASEIRKSITAGKCHCWTDCEMFPSIQRRPKYIALNLKEMITRKFQSTAGKARGL